MQSNCFFEETYPKYGFLVGFMPALALLSFIPYIDMLWHKSDPLYMVLIGDKK